MISPHTCSKILVARRNQWMEHLAATDGELTWDNAEASAQEAVRSLAEELKTRLDLGVAEKIRVYFDHDQRVWRAAVFLTEGRRKRVPLAEYFEMPAFSTDEVLRRAVIEVAFIHNVDLEPYDVQVADEHAS